MSTANIIIPAKNAGIGDLVYGTRADHIIIARGTANAATINGKNIYGGIFGFVAGYAMVTAPGEPSARLIGTFATGAPTFDKDPLMRNGKSNVYTQMNTARNAGNITGNNVSQPSDGLLSKAYLATPLTAATFDSQANAETKKRFGSWDEYIRQTLRVNGVPGTPFGAMTTGVKVHEFGRYMGMLCGPGSAEGTAIRYCYDYGEGSGAWWLPSMFEAGEMFIDSHLDKLNENNNAGWTDLDKTGAYWSCVISSDTNNQCWYYYGNIGTSSKRTGGNLRVRPVTLLKL